MQEILRAGQNLPSCGLKGISARSGGLGGEDRVELRAEIGSRCLLREFKQQEHAGLNHAVASVVRRGEHSDAQKSASVPFLTTANGA